MINPQPSVKVFHNARAKIYRDGSRRLTVCSDPIFKEDGWEERKRDPPFEKGSKPKKMYNAVREDSIHRAKSNVFDIALSNDFTHFITWTLSDDKIDRYNPAEVSIKLKNFLYNAKKRNDLKYLIIPELHKDGAIHLHGLISGNMKFVPNERGVTTESGQIIYNMPQWKYGFSTAIELYGDFINCAKYITKYISKDFRKIFGSFYYAGGSGLVRHPDVELLDIDYFSLDCKEYSKPFFGFKYLTISKEGEVL